MAIQWFPGHMNKLRRELKELLAYTDCVIEVADARAPLSSRNPMLHEIIGKKKRLLLLNKSDLADPALLRQWLDFYNAKKLRAIPVSVKKRQNLDRIKTECAKLRAANTHEQRQVAPRALIVGVPNCGKSSIINALARQKKAQTADRPGVTRMTALYKTSQLDIYDSPGALWPNLEDQEAAARLAALGSVKDEVYNLSEALELIYPFLRQTYAQALTQRYGVPPAESAAEFLEQAAKRFGKTEAETAARMVFNDLRNSKLGLVCLEKPPVLANAASKTL